MRTDILERKEDILKWIEEERTKAYMCQQLNCKSTTLNSYLKQMNVEYAGQQSKKGQYKGGREYRPASFYFDNSHPIHSHRLKEKLIRDGLKKNECELCGISTWREVKIPLELHHKNNNHFDNHFENLMILCPNCHSIQEGNSGANVGKYNTLNDKKEIATFCCDCGKAISSRAIRCKSCAAIERQKGSTNKPNRETLKLLIRTTSFLEIGRQFGVSDNAVRKWCDGYKLPRKAREIKNYSQEEWDKI